jgi:hypothetical protein
VKASQTPSIAVFIIIEPVDSNTAPTILLHRFLALGGCLDGPTVLL